VARTIRLIEEPSFAVWLAGCAVITGWPHAITGSAVARATQAIWNNLMKVSIWVVKRTLQAAPPLEDRRKNETISLWLNRVPFAACALWW